jgi:uncharacterized membrane protein YjgN (DUF898 family)
LEDFFLDISIQPKYRALKGGLVTVCKKMTRNDILPSNIAREQLLANRSFAFSLNAKTWWRPFLCLLGALLFALILFEFSWMRFVPKPTALSKLVSALSLTGSLFLIGCSVSGLAAYLFARIIPAVSLDGSSLVFKGDPATIAGRVLRGSLLSVLTLGLYIPRYIKNIAEYFSRKTECRKIRCGFAGSAEKLLKKYIPGVLLPAVAWFVISSCVSLALENAAKSSKSMELFNPAGTALIIGIFALFLVALTPFLAAFFVWLCDFRWENKRIVSRAETKDAALYIARQIGLSILTIGIFFPAASINIWRCLASSVYLMEEKKPKYRLQFGGKTLSGFFYFWSQTLLCLVSFGIYTPWACARIVRFFITNTGVAEC